MSLQKQTGLEFGLAHQYRMRHSRRAKYLRLNVCPDSGIEIVVPERMSLKHVAPFVRQHQEWINAQIIQLGLDRPTELPQYIHLAIIDEYWQVKYINIPGQRRYLLQQKQDKRLIIISGPGDEIPSCRALLQRWLRQQAKKHLPGRLENISRQLGLPYRKLSIRTQRTRWGSCSAVGNISLNDRLMLLPEELGHYVMTHELCHTRHMNHSAQFWQLVKRHIPDYKKAEQQLKKCRQYLPGWV